MTTTKKLLITVLLLGSVQHVAQALDTTQFKNEIAIMRKRLEVMKKDYATQKDPETDLNFLKPFFLLCDLFENTIEEHKINSEGEQIKQLSLIWHVRMILSFPKKVDTLIEKANQLATNKDVINGEITSIYAIQLLEEVKQTKKQLLSTIHIIHWFEKTELKTQLSTVFLMAIRTLNQIKLRIIHIYDL